MSRRHLPAIHCHSRIGAGLTGFSRSSGRRPAPRGTHRAGVPCRAAVSRTTRCEKNFPCGRLTLIASSGGAAGSPGSDASAGASPGTQCRSRSRPSASARRAVRRSPSRGLPDASVGSPQSGIHGTRRKARSSSSTADERPRRRGTGRIRGISSSFSRTGRSSRDSPSVSRRHLPAGHGHSRIGA